MVHREEKHTDCVPLSHKTKMPMRRFRFLSEFHLIPQKHNPILIIIIFLKELISDSELYSAFADVTISFDCSYLVIKRNEIGILRS